MPVSSALGGLRVVDFSNTLAGTQISQLLADFGAEVTHVEPPGGSILREQPAWPFWGRGKRSIVLDLKHEDDAALARSMAEGCDVVVETWRPGVADRFGLGYEDLSAVNPRLVYASVTGFGRNNRLSHMRGYEPVVMAKIGGLDAFGPLSLRDGPSFVTSPYCAFSAAQIALHGILAALVERESSGLGDRVETTLVQGILAHDCWNWLIRTIVSRYPGAFAAATPADSDRLVPNSPLFFRLMAGLSGDGRWLQFSQTTDRLWEAYLRAAGLEWTKQDPVLKNGTTDEDPNVRVAFWEAAINAVREKTYDEWMKAFDEEPDVWAETFRHGTELLHHPQIVHNGATVVIDDPQIGPVLQPGALVQMSSTPADLTRPAPRLDEDADAIRAEHREIPAGPAPASPTPIPEGVKPAPLAGVTVIELGTFYAAPFGATILADLGARVIKIEQLDGDPIRHIMPFPEVGGAKVLQGKESVAVDMASEEGRRIVLELVRRADVVLQTFRAGVAERHGYTASDLLAINPDLVYLNAPGYGIDGPCGHRPAFAPTMGAGSGLAYRNVGGPDNVPSDPDQSLLDVKQNSIRLSAAAMSVGHADGFSALGVASALLVGLLAKKRGAPGQSMMTSMLSTMAHTLSEDMVEYENRAPFALPDADLLGLTATYRLYRTADGWVFLAAPSKKESEALTRALDLDTTLDDAALAKVLEERFATKSAEDWERELDAHDVTCAAVVTGPIEEVVMLSGGMGREMGIVTETTHPVLGDYSRLTPLVRYERLGGVAGPAPLCGQQTDAVLTELGYDQETIDRLRAEHVLG
jgi:crotonobetainyl-CoA:carnitine CoA-transferase CaiB-like acyl-CoA transferase